MYTRSMQRPSDSVEFRPSWDWPSAFLVVLLIQVAATRFVMTDWTSFLFFSQTLAAFGSVLGLALGQSNFSRRVIYWLGLAYSSVLIPWQLTGIVEPDLLFGEKVASVSGRIWFSLGQFFTRKPVDDPLLFVAFSAFGFWIMGLTAGYYFARRRDYLAVVLPAGIMMLLIQAFDYFVPVRIWAFGVFVFLGLVLLGRMYLTQNSAMWDQQRVFVTFEARRDLMNSLLTISALAVLAAWSLPTSFSNIQSAAQSWNRFTRPLQERFSNAVSALESPYGSGSGGDFYGPSMSLSRNAPLGDTPVFTVRADDAGKNVPQRYYWRGHVYNFYANGNWSMVSALTSEFQPNADELTLPVSAFEREEVRFTLTLRVSNQGLLYAPAEPIWINRPGSVLTILTPEQGQDLAAWEADPILSGGDRYQVRALIANPTIEDLRAAGTDYPEWVSLRYLEVPENILPEVQALAEELTTDQLTAYDKAQAITFYLRREIEYSTSLEPAPQDRDPLLWVLFDTKKGFCVYYASAEIMLLRSLGIPARMSVGFAQGDANPDGTYTVRKVDAHAWPEVYFPGIGWVEFEPTGNQAALRRPLGSANTASDSNPSNPQLGLGLGEAGGDVLREGRVDESGNLQPVGFAQTTLGRFVWMISLILLAAGLYFLNLRTGWLGRLPDFLVDSYSRTITPAPAWIRRWAGWNKMSSIERSFQAVNLSLQWLGKPQPKHFTPIERARNLEILLPSASVAIDSLLAEHQSSLFTRRPGDPVRARQAAFNLLTKTVRARLQAILAFFTGAPTYQDRNL